MNRKGPQKHTNELRQTAIIMFEGGARLSQIARDLGVKKSTVKYWLDNASEFIAESPLSDDPVAARLKGRLMREAWDIIFAALKEIKRKLPEATVKELTMLMGELFDRQGQFGALTGKNQVPQNIQESSEKVKITVAEYLRKQVTQVSEVRQEERPVAQCEAEAPGKPEGAGESRKEIGNDSK